MAISTSITKAKKTAEPSTPLKRVLYIYHPLYFKKDEAKIKALIDSNKEVNIMILAYVAKLGLKVKLIDVETQKINGFILKTFSMILSSF